MRLHDARKIVIAIQQAIWLNPQTIPEIEFRVEMYFIAEYIRSDCVRISKPREGSFQAESGLTFPCVSIVLTPDDTIDGLGGNNLELTYYGGDNIPTGPHHGLSITLLSEKQRLYQRDRCQNPESYWVTNVLAEEKADFRFDPYVSERKWMPREKFHTHMQSQGVIEFLGLDNSAKFLAEVAYLNFWYTEHYISPSQSPTFEVEFDQGNKTAVITIRCNGLEELSFIYDIGDQHYHYGLMIMDGDNIVYRRNADQNEATEWIQNCMANDPLITDEYGNMLFIGEPIQE